MTTALTVREVESLILSKDVTVQDAARALATLPVSSRAIAITAAFDRAIDGLPEKEVDTAKERVGRRLERVMDEIDGQGDTLVEMINAGDVPAVLAMIRGHAGEFSTTASFLTPELIAELFEKDPDMQRSALEPFADQVDEGVSISSRSGRLVTLSYTLICETDPGLPAVRQFFNTEEGQVLIGELVRLARNEDDDAVEILRLARARGIQVPDYKSRLDADDEDRSGEDEDEE